MIVAHDGKQTASSQSERSWRPRWRNSAKRMLYIRSCFALSFVLNYVQIRAEGRRGRSRSQNWFVVVSPSDSGSWDTTSCWRRLWVEDNGHTEKKTRHIEVDMCLCLYFIVHRLPLALFRVTILYHVMYHISYDTIHNLLICMHDHGDLYEVVFV
jgi:hypothetical protein